MQDDDGAGQEPAPEPVQDPGTPPAAPPDTEKLKTENFQLREQLRQEAAKRLASEHNLPGPIADLLAQVPRDQQEAKAKELADAMPKGQSADPPAPPAEEPPDADKVKAMDATPPGTPPPAPPSDDEAMTKELTELLNKPGASFQDVLDYQAKLQEKSRGG